MPAKKSATSKIIDVTEAGQTAPNPSGRPVVVTNRPVLANDPMMVDLDAEASAPETAPLVSRQANTISPLPVTNVNDSDAPVEEATLEPLPPDEEVALAKHTAKTIEPPDTKIAAAETKKSPVPAASTAAEDDETTTDQANVDEETAADDDQAIKEAPSEAEVARRQELEELIANGTYTLPINTVQRRHSRAVIFMLCLLALVLAAVLFDVALDSGIISVPAVPHTHFFRSP